MSSLTLVHVVLSLTRNCLRISGAARMFSGQELAGLTALFLGTQFLTSVTGFSFRFTSYCRPIFLEFCR
jgi:hypothetical protein